MIKPKQDPRTGVYYVQLDDKNRIESLRLEDLIKHLEKYYEVVEEEGREYLRSRDNSKGS